MDTGRNDLLGEIAADAALERSDFLVQSTDQLEGGPFGGVESPVVVPKPSPVQPKQKAKTQSSQE